MSEESKGIGTQWQCDASLDREPTLNFGMTDLDDSHLTNIARLSPGALALSMVLASGFAVADNTVLATADQQPIESRALQDRGDQEVKDQVEASTRAFASLPFVAEPQAQVTLRPASGHYRKLRPTPSGSAGVAAA